MIGRWVGLAVLAHLLGALAFGVVAKALDYPDGLKASTPSEILTSGLSQGLMAAFVTTFMQFWLPAVLVALVFDVREGRERNEEEGFRPPRVPYDGWLKAVVVFSAGVMLSPIIYICDAGGAPIMMGTLIRWRRIVVCTMLGFGSLAVVAAVVLCILHARFGTKSEVRYLDSHKSKKDLA